MLQHEINNLEIFNGYAKQLKINRETAERQEAALREWKKLLTEKAEAARGFILVNKENKREYKIIYLWPSPDHALNVAAVKPSKNDTVTLWMANLHEFEVTNRKVTT